MPTIYRTLHEAGLLPTTSNDPDSRLRTASICLATATNESDDPIAGLVYRCDAHYEEEAGANQLRTAYQRAASPDSFLTLFNHNRRPVTTQAELTIQRDEYVAFTVNSVHSSSPVRASLQQRTQEAQLMQAARWIEETEPHIQDVPSRETLANCSVRQLREQLAHRCGELPATTVRKPELIQRLLAAHIPQRPHEHAAWFHYGTIKWYLLFW